MKNKKMTRFALISTLVVGGALAITAVFGAKAGILAGRGTDGHDANCQWNHYDAVEATYDDHGTKEFWACCTHVGQYTLTEPTEGHITDQGPLTGEYFDNMDPADERYVPQLEGGNHYVRMDVKGWQTNALLYTTQTYTGVTGVTFRVRLSGDAAAADLWKAVYISNDLDNWNADHAYRISNDGEWHLITFDRDYGPFDGYVKFVYNMQADMNAFLDIDEVRIDHSTGSVFETFEEGAGIFTLDANHARIKQEAKLNRYLSVDPNPSYDDNALLHTVEQFTNVTNVSFKFRARGLVTKQWAGASVNATPYGIDQYTDMNANDAYSSDVWMTRSFDFGSKSGYVNIINECGHIEAEAFDYDDIVITYDGGKVIAETFDGDSCLFVTCSKYARVVVNGAENHNLDAVVALDAERTTVENREYSPTFTVSRGIDEEYGSYVQLDDWACHSSQNRCWIGMTSTEPLALIKAKLGAAIESYYLFIYNPLETSFNLKILIERNYAEIASANLAPKAWTKVSMPLTTYGSYELTEATQLGFDHYCSENGEVIGSGFKFTSFYAEPKQASVNPAPFGVVAWDAQTGGLRDTKGYAPIYNLSHGVDADCGAYIQVDDWQCKSDKNQCWLTLSDTANSVEDIEAALGSSITNYFFFIYNPLESDFSFKVMLKSSSGMNPNMSVTCVAGAWTRVTVEYNHADSGTYPALTSASQIGLTHVFSGNGEVVGSGWKITSVYAE